MSQQPEDSRWSCPRWLDKRWDKRFSQYESSTEETSRIDDSQEDYASRITDIRWILKSYDDDVPSREVELVVQFCRDICMGDLEKHQDRENPSVWLDERSHPLNPSPNGHTRLSNKPLTALALYKKLVVQRYNHGSFPNADKRLIYIANLTRYHVAAIIWAAPDDLVPALRDALFRHLTLQTALRVQITAKAIPEYRLEFHMPYFALRNSMRKLNKTHRQQIDLSYLGSTINEAGEHQSFEIHDAHISVVTCGRGERRWTTYCFDDNDFNPDHEMGEDEFTAIKVDQIFNNHRSNALLNDANIPLWDPREYFLSTVLARTNQVLEEWKDVVCFFEPRVIQHTNKRPSFTEAGQTKIGTMGNEEAFQWTQHTLNMLGDLMESLRRSHEALVNFTSSGGDVAYFLDIYSSTSQTQRRMRECVIQIREITDDMNRLQGRLAFIQDRCEKLSRFLELRLNFESMKEAKWSGSSVDVTILGISPVVIACAFFSIPDPIVSFKKNLLSFTVSVFIVTLVLYIALEVKRGGSERQSLWNRLKLGTRYIWIGDDNLVTTNESGNRVLRRRRTQPKISSESIEMV